MTEIEVAELESADRLGAQIAREKEETLLMNRPAVVIWLENALLYVLRQPWLRRRTSSDRSRTTH